MAVRRQNVNVSASSMLATWQLVAGTVFILVLTIGLTVLLIASIAKWVDGGHIVINAVMAVAALCGYGVSYLGARATFLSWKAQRDGPD